MDLTDPDKLRATIETLFNEEIARTSLNFRPVPAAAIDPMVLPGLSWPGDLTDVDIKKLREAIKAIVVSLNDPSRPRQTINETAVKRAIEKSNCHYLWFC